MAVTDYYIKRFRGDNYPIEVTIKKNGTPVDLSNATVKLTIGLDTPVTTTGTVTDASGGVVQFDFNQSAVGTAGRFVYDIQVEDGGIITTYVKDIFELLEDITV